MKNLLVLAMLVLLVGCGSSSGERQYGDSRGGAAGSAAALAGAGGADVVVGAGGEAEPIAPIDPAGMDVECLRLLGIQGANGKWCAPEAIEVGTPVHIEYGDFSSCVWCYRRVCLATGDGYWLPVDC